MTGAEVYLADPTLARWEWRYDRGSEQGPAYLLFLPAWGDKHLPPGWQRGDANTLRVVLLDAEDGKRYETRMPAFYEADRTFIPLDFEGVVRHLQLYMYEDHFCACHRKIAAGAAGADTDEECEGERFKVERIEAPDLPGLVLYSETMTADELERLLGAAG